MNPDATKHKRTRPVVGLTMSPDSKRRLSALSKALDMPQSRIVEALIKARVSSLDAEERAAFDTASTTSNITV